MDMEKVVYPYIPATLLNKVEHTDSIRSLILELEHEMEIWPGQFIMVWLPGYEEIPLSPSYVGGNNLRITVKAVGETTSKLLSLDSGDRIYIRGPYGNGFRLDEDGRYLLIGGGYGAAPIIYAAHVLNRNGRDLTYVEGVKTATNQLFIDEALNIGVEAILVTEDGSSGIEGLVTDYVERILNNYDILLACGPEEMLNILLRLCKEHIISCQLSYERIVKCGIGLCGSCVLGDTGLLVCRDGPVFDGKVLLKYGYGWI